MNKWIKFIIKHNCGHEWWKFIAVIDVHKKKRVKKTEKNQKCQNRWLGELQNPNCKIYFYFHFMTQWLTSIFPALRFIYSVINISINTDLHFTHLAQLGLKNYDSYSRKFPFSNRNFISCFHYKCQIFVEQIQKLLSFYCSYIFMIFDLDSHHWLDDLFGLLFSVMF